MRKLSVLKQQHKVRIPMQKGAKQQHRKTTHMQKDNGRQRLETVLMQKDIAQKHKVKINTFKVNII